MPGAVTLQGGGIPGLTLRAWALVSSAGAVNSSSNVASITKGAAGYYTLNLSQAMPSANALIEVRPKIATNSTTEGWRQGATAAGAVTYATVTNGNPADADHWIGVYG